MTRSTPQRACQPSRGRGRRPVRFEHIVEAVVGTTAMHNPDGLFFVEYEGFFKCARIGMYGAIIGHAHRCCVRYRRRSGGCARSIIGSRGAGATTWQRIDRFVQCRLRRIEYRYALFEASQLPTITALSRLDNGSRGRDIDTEQLIGLLFATKTQPEMLRRFPACTNVGWVQARPVIRQSGFQHRHRRLCITFTAQRHVNRVRTECGTGFFDLDNDFRFTLRCSIRRKNAAFRFEQVAGTERHRETPCRNGYRYTASKRHADQTSCWRMALCLGTHH